MKQVHRLALMLLALLSASCSSVPSSEGRTAGMAGGDRGAKLIFERDGARDVTACPALIYVNGTLRSRLKVAETATIPVPAGYTNVRVKLGKFCGTIRDMIVTLTVAPDAEYRWRIGVGE